jgi:hypothetical protein
MMNGKITSALLKGIQIIGIKIEDFLRRHHIPGTKYFSVAKKELMSFLILSTSFFSLASLNCVIFAQNEAREQMLI